MKTDYIGLVRLLPALRRLPDAAGVVTLEPQEAEQIRKLGFEASASPWRVPRLPAQLVAENPILEALADNMDVFWRPRQAEPEPSFQGAEIVEQNQAVYLDVALRTPETLEDPTEPPEIRTPPTWNKESAAILSAINHAEGSIERRKLQKKFWRLGATAFNSLVHQLITEGLITVDGKMFHSVLPADQNVFHTSDAPDMNRGPQAARPALTDFGKEQ